MNPVDIIFLDAGRTLLHAEPEVGEVYRRIGLRHGVDLPAGDLAAAFCEAFRRHSREDTRPQERGWWREVVRLTFAGLGAEPDLDPLFQELYDYFALPEGWRLYPGTRETLAALRARGIRTGLISNWDDRLPELLEGLGLVPGLDPVVVSGIVGVAKPDPGIFLLALELAGVAPDRALMVGDDPVLDIAGARAAGIRALRIDHGAERSDGKVMRSLAELPDRL